MWLSKVRSTKGPIQVQSALSTGTILVSKMLMRTSRGNLPSWVWNWSSSLSLKRYRLSPQMGLCRLSDALPSNQDTKASASASFYDLSCPGFLLVHFAYEHIHIQSFRNSRTLGTEGLFSSWWQCHREASSNHVHHFISQKWGLRPGLTALCLHYGRSEILTWI